MRYAMWSPLPPQRSGIADYSYALLTALSDMSDVVAVSPGHDHRTVQSPVPVIEASDAAGLEHVNLYQMGNDAKFHAEIYRQALAVPGVVVLHDTSLLDFALSYHGGIDSPRFHSEVEFAHGPIRTERGDPATVNGFPAVPIDGVNTLNRHVMRMDSRLVLASRAVIVHDPWSAGLLRTRYPQTPIHVIPHGAVDDVQADLDARAALGWNDGQVVFGVFGGISRIKRIMVAVLAFANLRARWPQVRLVIAGYPDDATIVTAIRQVLSEWRIEDSVHLCLSPTSDEFTRLISTVDAVISLRWPTAGETSGVVTRAFGAGKLVITSDLPQHRHFDPTFCWRVSTEPAEESAQLVRALERVAQSPEEASAAGLGARQYVSRQATWRSVARAYRDACAAITADARSAKPKPPVASTRQGANVFADVRATTGLAESARRHIDALLDVGTDLTLTEFNTGAPNRSLPLAPQLAELRGGKEHPIDLWFVNINEFQRVPDRMLDRYTVAVWAWELPSFPAHARPQLQRVDELWVVSQFVADACRTAIDLPITVVPCAVPQGDHIPADRERFSLPTNGLIVLFTFSASSSDARKNPWAVVSAFRQAFRADEIGTFAHLVVKVNELHRFPEFGARLRQLVAEVNGILLTEEMSRTDMDHLLASCDIYLSLHRSEGFGLGMAEAMAMGKAVIATGYGGNVDFMPPGTAVIVGYNARPIEESDHSLGKIFGDWYEPGQLWADADTAQAARWLRRLADDPALRHAMGARSAQTIQKELSPRAVGSRMLQRLNEITSYLAD